MLKYLKSKLGAIQIKGKKKVIVPKERPKPGPSNTKVKRPKVTSNNSNSTQPRKNKPSNGSPVKNKQVSILTDTRKKKPTTQKDSLKKRGGIKVDERIKKKNKENRFLVWKMYSYKVFNALLKGSTDVRDPNLNSDSMQIGYSEIFTKTTVTRFYVIHYLQEDTPIAFTNSLIKSLKKLRFWTALEINIRNKPYRVDFSQNHIIQKLKTWGNSLNTDYTDIEGKDGKVYVRDFEMSARLKKNARLFRSFYKVRQNVGSTHESTIILKLQTKDKESMLVADKTLRNELRLMDIHFYQIRGTLLDFLRAFSPISKRKTISTDTTNRLIMTTRDIISTLPFMQGKIGDFGIWYGFDKLSGKSVWLDIMNTPLAKNILLMGKTGAGKSFLMSMFLFFHRSLEHNIFIHDHKGNEFTSFARKSGGLVISMTPSKSSYLSLWKLPIEGLKTEEELRAIQTEFFALAELEFLTLTEPDPKDVKEYKNIFNDFHKFVYDGAEVYVDNTETYINTDKITPEFLYQRYEQFMKASTVKSIYSARTLLEISIALYKYWHKKGARHELYTNPIYVSQLKDVKVICFDFGRAEQTRNSVPPNEEKLQKIFMNVSSSLYTNHNKKKKEWTVKVVEEIQSADEDILKFTSDDITEGRSKNMINYVLGNATGTLASGSKNAQNIIQNMTIRILGKLEGDAQKFYVEQYKLHGMTDALERIASDAKYKHCFLLDCQITDPPATAIVHAAMPHKVSESEYFKTVDYEEEKDY